MENTSLLIIGILVLATVTDVIGQCPPPTKIYETKPTCRDDYDCKYGRVCCMTSRGVKACAQPDKYGGQDKYYKQTQHGPGVYCGNIKCSPFQQCVIDPRTGRKICSHR